MAKKSNPRAALKEYRAKRNFTKSPEPTGEEKPPPERARELFFCVQKHWASHLHYDFRLEHKGVLLSWAVPKGPSLKPSDKRLAMRVEDHPFDYGEFEGVIPEGYGAGIVMLWDRGSWSPESGSIDEALSKGELKFKLNGVKLKGSWVLVRTGGAISRTWLLIKHRDEWSGDVDIAEFAPKSVKSDGTFKDILTTGAPEVWESHRTGSAPEGSQLAKVVAKVFSVEGGAAAPVTAKATTRARKSKPAKTAPAPASRPARSAARKKS